MKRLVNSISDGRNVLSIVAGQFLLIALKGDDRMLAAFREGYTAHFKRLFDKDVQLDIVEATVVSGRAFVGIMSSRYGWDNDAEEMLSSEVESLCRSWITGTDSFSAIERIRKVDMWSGLVSCTMKHSKIPLSLVDYVMMTLLPVLCGDGIRNTVAALINVMSDDGESLVAVDAALGECVKRLCCGIDIPGKVLNELKLVALLHMPKDEGVLSANAGFAYKLLQRQYANEEVK